MRDLVTTDLEYAPCGFLTFADTGTITGLNTTLLRLLEYDDKTELIGKSVETLLSIAGRIFYQTHFFPLLKLHGRTNEIFLTLRTKLKGELPVMCNAVRKEEDGIATHHCIFVPVAERRKYEQELLNARREAEHALEQNQELTLAKKELEIGSIELDRQLSRLTSINDEIAQFSKVISHDMQGSIRKIALFADMVSIDVKPLVVPERMAGFDKISSECIRLRQLAANLDMYISLNIPTEGFKPLDLNSLAQKAFTEATAGCNASFVFDTLPEIEGYEHQLKLLFSYIFRHAAQHTADGQPLKISMECSIIQQNSFRTIKGKYRYLNFARIVITDNASYHYDLRDAVFKLQRKKGEKHISFDLPFCKKIVDNHYGDIHMSSVNGNGAETTILLPTVQNFHNLQ